MLKSEYRITLATLVTLSRILLTPIIVYCMLSGWWYSACVSFVIAASTDVLDGFLARYLNQRTVLGASLDPVADKILLFSVFYALFCINMSIFTIPGWFLAFMLGKELAQIVGALVLYWRCGFTPIEANIFGKVTTVLHIIFVLWLFGCYFIQRVPSALFYTGFLWTMSVCMVVSFLQYVYIWVGRLNKKGL